MKKIGILILVLILFGTFVFAQDIKDTLGENVEKLGEGKEKIENFQDKANELKDSDSGILSERLKEKLLDLSFVEKIDILFKKSSGFFNLIIGEPYEFSFKFFLILTLWVFVFINTSILLQEFFPDKITGWLVGFFVTIFLAYFKLFELFYQLLGMIVSVFKSGEILIIILLTIILFAILVLLRRFVVESIEEEKELMEKEEAKQDAKFFRRMLRIFIKRGV